MSTKDVKKIKDLIEEVQSISENIGVGNIFYNEGYIDLFIADILGHTYNTKTQGGDAFDSDGNWIEYKTININSKGPGSFQFHWLSKEKIDKYKKSKFFFAIRKGTEVLKIYTIDNEIIMPILEEEYRKGEEERISTGKKKSISAHKSFSEKSLVNLGGKLIYEK